MANTKEIQKRMKSIQDTMKITSAMYMISSAKLRSAKQIVGVRRPMICKIPVTISDKKGLTVDFIPIKGETMITAIRILKMD